MASYQSERVNLPYPAETVFGKLSNLEGLGDLLKKIPADQIPADQLRMLEQVQVTPDTISFPAGPVGNITLKVAELKDPSLIRLEGVGTPVPISLAMNIVTLSPDTCQAYVQIDIQIPVFMKPMVNGPLQKMADQFAQMLRQVPMN